MELWQQLGYKSFGAWRRDSEKRRRAAKKAAADTTVACDVSTSTTAASGQPHSTTAIDDQCRPVERPAQLVWEPLQIISSPPQEHTEQHDGWSVPRPSQVPLHELREQVQVTRTHSIEHTSPGGTTRFEAWISPPGGRKSARSQNKPGCATAPAWQMKLVAAMRAEPGRKRVRYNQEPASGPSAPWSQLGQYWHTAGYN